MGNVGNRAKRYGYPYYPYSSRGVEFVGNVGNCAKRYSYPYYP